MKVFFLALIGLLSISATAQSSIYNIELFSNVIGKGNVTKATRSSGEVEMSIVTNATANVMFKERTSSSDIKIVMKENKLYSCVLKREKDGEVQNVSITWNGASYDVVNNGVATKISKAITFTTTHLFFEEPKTQKEVYVERINEWVPIEKVAEGEYLTKVDGADNYYTYKNGVLVEMRIKKGVNIYMKRV